MSSISGEPNKDITLFSDSTPIDSTSQVRTDRIAGSFANRLKITVPTSASAINSKTDKVNRVNELIRKAHTTMKTTPTIQGDDKWAIACNKCLKQAELEKQPLRSVSDALGSGGITGSYVLIGKNGDKLAILKPLHQLSVQERKSEEHQQKTRYAIPPEMRLMGEKLAFMLGRRFGVPRTEILDLPKTLFPHSNALESKTVPTSVQWFAPNATNVKGQDISHASNLPQIAALDILLGNTDRHFGNLLMTRRYADDGSEHQLLIPIDHGFVLSTRLKDNAVFDWIALDTLNQPWPNSVKNTVQSMKWPSIKKEIQREFPGIEPELLQTIYTNFIFLQLGIQEGLTPNQMAAWMNSNDVWSTSKFTGEAGSLLRHCFEKASSSDIAFEKQIRNSIKDTIKKFKEAQQILQQEIQTQYPDNPKEQNKLLADLQSHTKIDKYSGLSGRPPLFDLFYKAMFKTDTPGVPSSEFDKNFRKSIIEEIKKIMKERKQQLTLPLPLEQQLRFFIR